MSFGKSEDVTVSYTINIPAKTRTVVEIGTKAVKTTGTIVEYKSTGAVIKTPVNVDYSNNDYVDKTSTKL